MQETKEVQVQFLGWEDPLEEGTANRFGILAWRFPKEQGAWQAMVCRVAESQRGLKRLSTHTHVDGVSIPEVVRVLFVSTAVEIVAAVVVEVIDNY